MSTAVRRLFWSLTLAGSALLPASAQSLSDGFDPHLDGIVYAVARQADGRILIGGTFGFLHPNLVSFPVGRAHIARLNHDGTVDVTFDSATDGHVTSIALQADGKILIAGRFTSVLRASGTGDFVPRNGLARLHADGSLDESFDPRPTGVNHLPLAVVRALAVQADGRILIGGGFNELHPNGTGTPVARNRIARLNSDGTVDTTFDVGANNVVLALLVQPDGRILMGGGFTEVQPAGGGAAVSRPRMVRLNADGTIDETWAAVPDNRVLGFALQPDGGVLVCGEFRGIVPVPGATAEPIRFIARFAPDGTLDTSFNALASGAILAMGVQADGKILIGGNFVTFANPAGDGFTARRSMARLNPDGSLDASFAPNPNAVAHAFAVQPDAGVVVGGAFSALQPVGSSTSSPRMGLARVQADGSLDAEFAPNAAAAIAAVAEESDGSLIVAGSFSSFGGFTQFNLVRISADGFVDPTFTPTISGTVSQIAAQSDGKILIAGSFTFVNGTFRSNIARLNADGTLDTAFDPNLNANVAAMKLQSDGRILVGGSFTTVRPNSAAEATNRRFLARLNADGTVDMPFFPNPNNAVNSIIPLSDGRILVGGAFASFQPQQTGDVFSHPSLARLNADGTVDETFISGTNGTVLRMLLQPDDKLIVAGTFNGIGRLTDTELVPRRFVGRFNADGTVDATFDPSPDSSVEALEIGPDGTVLIGGGFESIQPNEAASATSVRHFAWLDSSGNLDAARTVGFDQAVRVIRAQDSSFLVAGDFTRLFTAGDIGTAVETPIVRLNADASLDPSFAARAGAPGGEFVSALAIQSTGHIILGGEFSRVYGVNNANLMRMNAAGVADAGFRPRTNGAVNALLVRPELETDVDLGGPVSWLGADGDFRDGFDPGPMTQLTGTVHAVAFQADGKVLVGGSFDPGSTAVGANLVRFNPDGSLDESFVAATNGAVRAIAVHTDGTLLIGGAFTTVHGQSRNRVARLNADGSLDAAYDPNANGAVRAIVILSEGGALIGGEFTTLRPNGAESSTTRRAIARLNADGTLDGAFVPVPAGDVHAIAVQSDDKILIGGEFTSVSSVGRAGIARLNADGTVDESFFSQPSAPVNAIVLESDGQMLVGGLFFSFAPDPDNTSAQVPRAFVARLNSDGSVDEAFNAQVNDAVHSIAPQDDGSIVIGGSFSSFFPVGASVPIFRNGVARLDATGAVDLNFDPNADGEINVVAVADDGSIVVGGDFESFFPEPIVLVGGSFTTVLDANAPYLAWLNRNGSVDFTRTLAPDGEVFALAGEAGSTVIVAGAFTEIDGTPRQRLARLSLDGDLDADFDPGANDTVYAASVQADGRILVAGDFTTIAGSARQGIARLNGDGTIDGSFNASVDGSIFAIQALASGQVIIAGEFLMVNGSSRPYLARLNADGTLDGSFAPAPDATVYAVAQETGGELLVGGAFDTIGGASRPHFARLLPDGSADASVSVEVDGDVLGIAVQNDGRALIAGSFSSVNGQARNRVARLPAFAAASEVMTVSDGLDTVTLTLSGSSPDFSAVTFAHSVDGTTWTDFGSGSASGTVGTWTGSGAGLPSNTTYFVRARGINTNSRYASSSRRDIVWQFYNATPAYNASTLTGGGSGGGSTGSGSGGGGSNGSNGSGSGGSSAGGGSGGGSGGSGSGSGSSGGSSGSVAEFGLRNLSGRGVPTDDQPVIGGFVIGGTDERTLLVRGVGPGLADFGVNNVMAKPLIRLFDRNGVLLREVAPGSSVAMTSSIQSATGAFALDPEGEDTAFVAELAPGAYTFHILDAEGGGGIALAEVYIADSTGSGQGLANVSIRGYAGDGAEVLIGGFVSDSPAPRRVLIRGVGPGLEKFGVADAVVDPVLRVYDQGGELLAENDDWDNPSDMTAAEMAAAMAAVGAFQLAAGSGDAALLITLPTGAHTIHVSGAVPGSALIEIYEAP